MSNPEMGKKKRKRKQMSEAESKADQVVNKSSKKLIDKASSTVKTKGGELIKAGKKIAKKHGVSEKLVEHGGKLAETALNHVVSKGSDKAKEYFSKGYQKVKEKAKGFAGKIKDKISSVFKR